MLISLKDVSSCVVKAKGHGTGLHVKRTKTSLKIDTVVHAYIFIYSGIYSYMHIHAGFMRNLLSSSPMSDVATSWLD